MPFINKKQAFQLLDGMKKGTCAGDCRRIWLRNIQYALKTKSNPLLLTEAERKRMESKVAEVKGKKTVTRKIDKKYLKRDSPPYPANEYCGQTKKGNDGKMYVSKPDKNNVCRWSKVSA